MRPFRHILVTISLLLAPCAAPAATQAIGDLVLQHSLVATGDVTPAQITADQNDYAPASFSTAMNLRLSSDASRNITGLAGGAAGRTIMVHNVGSFSIVLKNQSTSSTAANRFAIGADVTLTTNTSVWLQYDGTSSRWRIAGAPGTGGGGSFTFDPPQTLSTYQTGNALTLTTPNPTDVSFDTSPIAALYVNGPAAATTRNYISGIWVNTNGASTDKGRGIAVVNTGASDSLYLQQDGPGSTGIAALLTTNATGSAYGGVFGTTLPVHTALTLRQETALVPTAQSATLLSVEANGSATEMARFNSTIASQQGIVFRLTGSGSTAFSVLGAADAVQAQMTATGSLTLSGLTVNSKAIFDKGSSAGTLPADIAASSVIRLGNADVSGGAIQSDSFGAGAALLLSGRNVGGTRASQSATPANNKLYTLQGFGFDTALTTSPSATYFAQANSLWSASNRETKHVWQGTPSGSTSAATWMTLDGANGLVISSLGLNNTPIGNVTAAAGSFSTLTSSTTAKFTAADNANNGFIGATKAVRFWASSTGYNIEGVDNTLIGSYQPLNMGGLSFTFSLSGVAAASVSSSGFTTNAAQNVAYSANTATSMTLDATNYAVTLNNAAGATANLPSLAGITGRTYRIKNVGTGDVTVTANGGDTIFTTSAVSSFTLMTGESADVTATSAYWIVQ